MNSFTDLLTRNDCQNLLEKKLQTNQFKLTQYSIVPCSDKMDGFMGFHLRLKCLVLLKKTNETKLVTFFIKKQLLDAIDDQTITEIIQTWPGQRKELLFYDIMDDAWNDYRLKWLPKYYSFNKDRTLLILDDLSVHGFTVVRRTTCDLAECRATFRALAQMHAFSIVYEMDKTRELKKPWTFLEAYGKELFEELLFTWDHKFSSSWFQQSIESIKMEIDFFERSEIRADSLKNKFEKLIDNLLDLFKPSKQFRNVVCHGDLWGKNIMLKYDENEVAQQAQIIDFQIVRYLPPIHDLIMFLYVATATEFRQLYLKQLLDFYYDEFSKELQLHGLDVQDIYPKLDFEQSFKEYLLFGKYVAGIYRQTLEAGEDYLTKMLDTKYKGFEFLLIDRVKYLLPLHENSDYIKNFGEVIHELNEFLSIDDVTREDCYQIIAKQLNTTEYKLDKFHLNSLAQFDFLIYKKILNIAVTHKNQQKIFNYLVKLPSKLNEIKQINKEDLINHEIVLYRYIFNELFDDVIPKCYVGIKNHFIILENLLGNQFEKIDQYAKLNFTHVTLAIQTLAKFHAATLIFEHKTPLNNKNTFNTFNSYPYYDFIENIFDAITTTVNHLFPNEKELNNITKSIKSYLNTFKNFLQPSTTYKNVLCHTNLNQNNLLFKYNTKHHKPIDCRFQNMQMCRYLPPAIDIQTFLLSTTDVTFRNQHYDDILKLYYDTLNNELEKSNIIDNIHNILSYYDLLASIKEMQTFSIFQVAINAHLLLINEKFINDTNNNKMIDLTHELHADVIVENLKLNLKYKEFIKEIHLVLMKHCIDNFVS